MNMPDPTRPKNARPDGNVAATDTIDNRAAEEVACRDRVLTMSFGQHAKDNRPVARTLTFDDLIREFSTADTSHGTLTAAEYHALDKADPLQKARRSRE